jgi:release factor glutamine methyltransferase
VRLITLPGVFSPRSDSVLLARIVAERARPGSSALDPFTGSGILAIAAARAGARTTAIDVSRRAVACAALNARLAGVRVRALRGDLFEPVAGERFDLIAANPPYVPGAVDGPVRGAARAWEGGPDGRALIDRLCDEAPRRLAPGGELLLIHSHVCGEQETLRRLEAGGLEAEVLVRSAGALGPLMAARRQELEAQEMLAPGQREEELLVFSGRAAGRTPAWQAPASPRTATAPTSSAANSS